MLAKLSSDESVTRIETVNLGRAWITPRYRRTDRVITMIREFAKKSMKSDEVKLDQDFATIEEEDEEEKELTEEEKIEKEEAEAKSILAEMTKKLAEIAERKRKAAGKVEPQNGKKPKFSDTIKN